MNLNEQLCHLEQCDFVVTLLALHHSLFGLRLCSGPLLFCSCKKQLLRFCFSCWNWFDPLSLLSVSDMALNSLEITHRPVAQLKAATRRSYLMQPTSPCSFYQVETRPWTFSANEMRTLTQWLLPVLTRCCWHVSCWRTFNTNSKHLKFTSVLRLISWSTSCFKVNGVVVWPVAL